MSINNYDSKFNGFPKETLTFLNGLGDNNNRQWFNEHRNDYENYYLKPALAYIDAFGYAMSKKVKGLQYEAKINRSLYRINKDTRFSNDKRPYKTHIAVILWKGPFPDRHYNPGMYLHLENTRLLMTTGSWMMRPEMLQAYRNALQDSRKSDELVKIEESLNALGLALGTENSLKMYPRGFKDHPMLKYARLRSVYTEVDEQGSLPDIVHKGEFLDYSLAFYEKTVDLMNWLADIAEKLDSVKA